MFYRPLKPRPKRATSDGAATWRLSVRKLRPAATKAMSPALAPTAFVPEAVAVEPLVEFDMRTWPEVKQAHL